MPKSKSVKKAWVWLALALILTVPIIYLCLPQVYEQPDPTAIPLKQALNWNQDSITVIQSRLTIAQNLDAFVALEGEKEIFSYGESDKLINLHSARKPIMSLLFGIAMDKGLVDLNETLGDLGIREYGTTLSEQEASATVRNLLMARSGVYLEADAEAESSRINRPKRNQYKPGEFYFYNNFDFNVLASILKIKTGMSYEDCLDQWLAKPLGMQHFHPDNVNYGTPFSAQKTMHPAYKTWMSARDLARIGAMLAQGGVWNGKRLVSKKWMLESMAPQHYFSEENIKWPRNAYGYLWSLDTETGNIWGSGYGGQFLMIDTTHQLALVQRHYTGNSLISQLNYLRKNTQSNPVDLMQVWYALMRNYPTEENQPIENP